MPLHIAALDNNLPITMLLLELRANPSLYAMGVAAGNTALGAAVACGSRDVSSYLQELQLRQAVVPASYSQRYLRLNRFVPIEVSYE